MTPFSIDYRSENVLNFYFSFFLYLFGFQFNFLRRFLNLFVSNWQFESNEIQIWLSILEEHYNLSVKSVVSVLMLFLFLKNNYCLFLIVYWSAKIPQWLRKKMILNKLFNKLKKYFFFFNIPINIKWVKKIVQNLVRLKVQIKCV